MRAYVLCGGFGTRLRSVIQDSQKALVAVHGEPFLARVLRQLKQAGIDDIVLCAHYRADQVAAQLDALAHGAQLRVQMVVEPTPLGTGGALLNALREFPPKQRYLVLNADTYLDASAYRLLVCGKGDQLLAVRVGERSRYGSLAVDRQGQLVALLEKGAQGEGMVNAGVYAFTVDAFVGQAVRACSMELDLLPQLVAQGIAVTEYAGRFIDIGTPESLDQYTHDFKADTSR